MPPLGREQEAFRLPLVVLTIHVHLMRLHHAVSWGGTTQQQSVGFGIKFWSNFSFFSFELLFVFASVVIYIAHWIAR